MSSKILFLIDSLSGGGTERSLAELLPYLDPAGFQPVLATMSRGSDPDSEELRRRFDVRLLRPGGWLSRVRQVRALLASEQPLLIHTMLFRSDITGRFAAPGTGVPVLCSLVNTTYAPARYRDPNIRPWKLEAVRLMDAWTARHLTFHFHAVSQAVKDSAIETLGVREERITVVERGRDAARLGEPSPERRRESRSDLGLSPSDEVVVHVGRQVFQKGQKTLLQALDHLRHRSRLKVLIVGAPGPASHELQRLCKELQLDSRVRFLGHRPDVPNILAAADVFAFPSLLEGMPGAVLEAMALGLPIVASDIAPVREVVEADKNAILVPPGSASALAAGIDGLLDSPSQAAKLGARSRQIFLSRFTLEHSARRMVELYRKILGDQLPATG